MSSSVLRACSAQYYTACLPPASGDLHRSGSANQLNGHAAGHLLHASSSPSSQPRQPASSAQTSPQPTAMNATASSAASPARPQRTHSERSQRTSRMSLYRSNSSLDLDHNNGGHHGGGGAAGEPGALRGGPTRRDYGSASSLDLLAASAADGSFFAMLREYRAGRREDQRSPGPANIQEFLRGRLDPAPALQNASNALAHGALEEGSSPRLKTKFQRLLELRDRGKGWSRLPGGSGGSAASAGSNSSSSAGGSASSQESSLFRKWKPGGRSESADARSLEPASLADPAEDRLRRRALAHYDCQSLGANLSRASGRLASILGRRRNTTTGASAASMLQRGAVAAGVGGEDGAEVPDSGDGRQSALLLSCPFFRNEVGGEPQRALGLTRATSRALRSGRSGSGARNSANGGPWHRPSCLSGLAVLERHGLDDGACPYQRPSTLLDGVDRGALYYRTHFHGKGHQNWFGIDDRLGPVAVSLRKDRLDVPNSTRPSPGGAPQTLYRIIVRTSELATLRCSLAEESLGGPTSNGRLSGSGGSSGALPVRELLDLAAPELQASCLRLAVPGPSTEQQLIKLDEQGLMKTYKVGVMYCRAGQSTEEEMYNNENAGPAFEEFLEMLGHKVRLKGFQNYRAGLDNKTDTTGLYSVYSTYEDCEIMFHVSTMLPYTPSNKQQLLRKRHIGNDIVTLVFQEPRALPFTPKNIRSHFQHVFIIVRAIEPCTSKTRYSVAVSRSKEVPVFGPPIPEGATFAKSKKFTDFILAKVINAENAAHRSEKFATMAQRTRQEYLKDLAANYSTGTTLDSGPKFSLLSFGVRKKERPRPRFVPDGFVRGAISWSVQVEDQGQGCVCDCTLGVSASSLVLLDEGTGEPVFGCATAAVLGWSSHSASLKLFYHQGECLVLRTRDSDADEVQEIVTRLACVTNGCETEELILCRNAVGQLGFHVQSEGLVTEVESEGLAWKAGLRRGCRLLEICKVAVATLSYDQMVDLLKTSIMVSVTVVPPHKDGSPRRGCPLQNCSYFGADYDSALDLSGSSSGSGGGGSVNSPRGQAPAVGQQVPSYAKARARSDMQFRCVSQPQQRPCEAPADDRPSPVPPPVPARMARSPPGRGGGSPSERLARQVACNSLPPLVVAPPSTTSSGQSGAGKGGPPSRSGSGGSSPSLVSLMLLEPLPGPLVVSRSELSLAQLSSSSHDQRMRAGGAVGAGGLVAHPSSRRQHSPLDPAAATRDTQHHHRSQGDLSSLGSSSLGLDRCCLTVQAMPPPPPPPPAHSDYQSDSSSEWPLGAGSSADELSTCGSSHLGSPLPRRGLSERVPSNHSPKIRLGSCRVLGSGNSGGGASGGGGEEVMRSPLASLRHGVLPNTAARVAGGGGSSHPAGLSAQSWSPSSAKGGGGGSSSAGSSAGSTSGGPSSTFQEDLLRLIGPDYMEEEDSDSEEAPWCPLGVSERPRSSGPATPSSSLERAGRRQGLALRCHSSCPSAGEDVILTTAQPAQVIACCDLAPSSAGGASTGAVGGTMDAPGGPKQPEQRLQDLEDKVVKLQETLAQEQHRKASLEHQVLQLQQENHRLHEQSESASAQLRRFTDWFFGSSDT
ncbi:signal-induced proliferation-associated 1-like protein 2 [Haemaphysalis longicornis]